jgi:uroporphyrinogen-III synthase
MNSSLLHDRHIVITRPIGQAGKLSKLVQAAGGEVISFPLIEIAPLSNYQAFEHTISILHEYDWAIFISSNAVQNGMPFVSKLELPSSLKFAAIGPSTAAELSKFGIQNTNQKVMIFRGVGGREVLADTLKSRGAEVSFAECYQRINPQQDLSQLTTFASTQSLDAIVVTSSEAMRNLLAMANHQAWLKNVKLCVNHARIAEEPTQLGLNVHIAAAPGDEAMLACLIKAVTSSASID